MFYKTTIKAVTNSGAIDVQGRSLSFIGYLPVKAGDTVFTDGRFIFGNAPPKGVPAIFDEPSGIPVLGDSDSGGEEELRGYFTNRGKFKKYRIAGDEWLVNDDKNFKHDEGANIIDAEISDDGKLLTVEKKVTQIAEDDYDYHWGFYQQEANGIFAPINFGRIAVHVPGDNFYDNVGGFQNRRQADGSVRFFYRNIGGSITSSYTDGFYWAFEDETTGLGINMATCYFFLRSLTLDYSMADNKIIRKCEFIIDKDGKEIERVDVADLLKDFEDAAKTEVALFPDRESVKHVKSRAIVHNFKILPDGLWEALIEAEVWASNTFYNENNTLTETTPFHISSTVSHSHLLLKFNAGGSYEKIWAWKFLYPLQLRDSTFGEYYFGEREDSAVAEGAWIIRTRTGITAGIVDGKQRYYSEIWRDYFSQLENNPLEYDTPIEESTDKFYFPVQDDYRAKITNCDDEPDKWQFDGISDADNKPVIGAILPDETDAHKWNMSCVSLKGGGFLFGIHKDTDRDIDGALYKIDDKGTVEQLGDGLKNFRLRELKRISKAKK